MVAVLDGGAADIRPRPGGQRAGIVGQNVRFRRLPQGRRVHLCIAGILFIPVPGCRGVFIMGHDGILLFFFYYDVFQTQMQSFFVR